MRRTKTAAWGAAFLLALAWTALADDLPVPSRLEAEPQGWADIVPGPGLKGWFRIPVSAGGKLLRDQWHVENGILTCDGDGGHDMLLLDRELGNGIFHVEFRFVKLEGKTGYNSGVYIRNSRDGATWHQAQVGSLSGGYFFGATPDGAGGVKKFNVGGKPCRVTEAGEWNTFELAARGPVLSLWVNGFPAAELPDCGLAKGYLGLEGEGYHIEFRNLKYKELP